MLFTTCMLCPITPEPPWVATIQPTVAAQGQASGTLSTTPGESQGRAGAPGWSHPPSPTPTNPQPPTPHGLHLEWMGKFRATKPLPVGSLPERPAGRLPGHRKRPARGLRVLPPLRADSPLSPQRHSHVLQPSAHQRRLPALLRTGQPALPNVAPGATSLLPSPWWPRSLSFLKRQKQQQQHHTNLTRKTNLKLPSRSGRSLVRVWSKQPGS